MTTIVPSGKNPANATLTHPENQYRETALAAPPTVTKIHMSAIVAHGHRPSQATTWQAKKIRQFLAGSDGRYWTRTSDPYDVNVVLYQLS